MTVHSILQSLPRYHFKGLSLLLPLFSYLINLALTLLCQYLCISVYSWVRPPPCVHVLYNVVARVANLPMNCLPFWYWPIIHHDEYPGPLIISQLCKDYKVMYVRYVRWDDHHRSSQSHIMKLLIKNSDIFRLFQDSTK